VADDIVARLRNPQLPCICIDVVLPSCHPCNARLDAADEIERLRHKLDGIACYAEHSPLCDYHVSGMRCNCGLNEARRG
jgi:hypothetical protein